MSDDQSGRTLGRYQVLERLGRGGMAEVYRAYQPSLDRYVAIKVIYPHLASDPALLERFGREARAVAALHHPNIVQVHDFDVQAGTAFMAMEFISGPTLKAAIQSLHERGQLLPLPVVGQIVGQLADALGYAHEQRVIHRDVKPANVLIRRRSSADTPLTSAEIDALLLGIGPASVVLTDFGVARMIKDSVEHTAAGTILGSPAYMSPEQGRGERVGPGSDIYSLGIVLYELLTGQVPFDADTPFAIVIKHSTAPLPPPRRLRPDLPAPVEQVLLKSLAKDPLERFNDAAAFGAAIREATAGAAAVGTLTLTPIPAAPARPAGESWPSLGTSRETRVVEVTAAPTPQAPAAPAPAPTKTRVAKAEREPKPRRRSCLGNTLIALAALAVIALIVVGAFVAGGALVFRGLGQAGALVVPTEFSQQATAAAAQGTVLPFGPETPGPTATVDPDNVVAVALINGHAACPGPACPGGDASKALAIYNTALAKQPDSAALLAARAQLYVWWDAHAYVGQARADIAAALSQDEESAAAYLARASLTAATTDSDADRAAALADYNKAVDLAPDLIDARLARADFLVLTGDVYVADSPGRAQALADSEAVLALDPQNVPALNLRGEMRYAASQFEQSLADCNAVLAIDQQNVPALLRRGRLYRNNLGKPQEAIADFAAVLALEPDNYQARESHGGMLAMTGDYRNALADIEAMIKLAPESPIPLSMLGFVRLGLGQPQVAQQSFDKALAISAEAIDARYGRGLALLAQDKPAEAIPDLEAAAKRLDDLYYVQEVFTGGHSRAPLDLARAYMATGRQAEAGPLLDDSVQQNEGWYLPYLVRSRYRRATGDTAGALADLRSAAVKAASDAERAEVAQEQGR